jgi:hypothetical protein
MYPKHGSVGPKIYGSYGSRKLRKTGKNAYISDNLIFTCKKWDGELESVEFVDNPAGSLLSSGALLTTAR